MKVTIDEKKKTMIIEVPLDTPHDSKSGKTKIVYTSGGGKSSGAQFAGKDVIVNLSAYFKP